MFSELDELCNINFLCWIYLNPSIFEELFWICEFQTNPVNISGLTSCKTASYLQIPDIFTFFGDSFNCVSHQSYKHVEQQDVSKNDVQDEKDVENLFVLNVISKLQISHPNSELEQLQCCKTDIVVSRLFALKWLDTKRPSSCAIGQLFKHR